MQTSTSVPRLKLSSFETGGGWGLGDHFARLPPAGEQEKMPNNIYKVARAPESTNQTEYSTEASQSSETSPSILPVPVTVYQTQPEDDDNTFVDHGSITVASSSAIQPQFNAGTARASPHVTLQNDEHGSSRSTDSTRIDGPACTESDKRMMRTSVEEMPSLQKPPTPRKGKSVWTGIPPLQANNAAPAAGSILSGPERRSNSFANGSSPCVRGPSTLRTPIWDAPRLVSRMSIGQTMRDMTVAPDGKSLWTAIGDDPLTLLELHGTELQMSHTIESVTQVYCMTVVRIPETRPITFKNVPDSIGRPRLYCNGGTKKATRSHRGSTYTRENSRVASEQGDTFSLWCGLGRGSIAVVDLSSCTEDGVICNAHTQAVNKIWYLDNGKVWTAGRDKSIKVWDPQTRRKLKSRHIAAILSDLCYVSPVNQVWAIAGDNFIRVYEAGGDNAKVLKNTQGRSENTVKMKSDITLVRYCPVSCLVWVALTHGTVLMDPTSYEVVLTLPLTLTALEFHKKTALVTGHGPLLESEVGCVALLDIGNSLEPSLLFVGSGMDNICSNTGIRLLSKVPLAVVAQGDVASKKKMITVFTYEETKPFGKQADFLKEPFLPPQRKVTVGQRNVPAPPVPAIRAPVKSTSVVLKQDVKGTSLVTRNHLSPEENVDMAISNRVSAVATPSQMSQLVQYSGPSQAAPSREILSSLTTLEKRTEDMKDILVNLQHPKPFLADFVKLHNTLTELALQPNIALPTLDAEENETIDREYGTPEGKMMAMMVARLRSRLCEVENTFKKVSQRNSVGLLSPDRSSSTNGPRAVVNYSSDAMSADLCGDTTTIRRKSTATDGCMSFPSSRLSLDDRPSESIITWATELSRAAQQERQAYMHQLQSLQRHNGRIMERNSAFLSGATRIRQAMCTYAQHLLTELGGAVPPEEWSPLSTQRQRHLHASLLQTLKTTSDLSATSTPKEINSVANSLVSLLPLLLASQHSCRSSRKTGSTEGSFATEELRNMYHTISSGTPAHETEINPFSSSSSPRKTNGAGNDANNILAPSCTSSTITSVASLHPRRLLAILKDEIETASSFLSHTCDMWSVVEEARKSMFRPYGDGKLPDLKVDFMQCAVLWDLRQAQVMLDVCRTETVVTMMEALLDLEVNTYFNDDDPKLRPQSLPHAPLSARPSGRCGIYASETEKQQILADAAAESKRLVSISIELENVSTRIRDSLMHFRDAVPDSVDPQSVGGFLTISWLRVYECRLQGLLYWGHVSLRLLVECLENMEHILFPVEGKIFSVSPENLLLMSRKLDDWRGFLQDVRAEMSEIRSVIAASQREGGLAMDHIECVATGMSDSQLSPGRRCKSAAGNEANACTSGYQRFSSCSTDTREDVSIGRRITVRVLIFGIYLQLVTHYNVSPLLFRSPDAKKTEELTRSFYLMSFLDCLAENTETLRTKTEYLLKYCQSLHDRMTQLFEGASEGVGSVTISAIPSPRPTPLMEVYVRDFCKEVYYDQQLYASNSSSA